MTDEMLCDLEFDKQIKAMPDRDLLEFMAVQVHEISTICPKHLERIESLEDTRDERKRAIGTAGTLGGAVALGVGSILVYLLKRLGIDI